jgi:serine protease Do
MLARHRMRRNGLTRNAFIVTVFVFALGSSLQAQDQANTKMSGQPKGQTNQSSITALRQMGKAFASIAEKASPAVVGIKADKVYTQQQSGMPYWFFEDPFGNDMFERFFGRPGPRQQQPQQRKVVQPVQGSGFIVSDDGYILTNNHLVGDAENIRVQLSDNKEFKAKVIGADADSDVALVKIDANDLPHLELADSDALEVGEWVLAIGNPFGLSHTVTAGIVSAKGRSGVGISTYEDFIQTDAAINPGNSGGPLLNLDGKVVGINTAIISRSGGNMGIGLAIPINMAKTVYKQLIAKGKVVRGYLGLSLQDLTPELAQNFGMSESKGAVVTKVLEDSPAEKAGMKFEDVITELDGKALEDSKDLMNRVAELSPGTKVNLTVVRQGKKETVAVELGERPSSDEMNEQGQATIYDLGFDVKDLTDELADRLGYEDITGVVVVEVRRDSEAYRKGIEPGMVIMKVGHVDVTNTKEYNREIRKLKKGDTVVLLVTDGQQRRFITLEIPED